MKGGYSLILQIREPGLCEKTIGLLEKAILEKSHLIRKANRGGIFRIK